MPEDPQRRDKKTHFGNLSVLSSMYQNNPYIEFVNSNMKIKESKWRIVITLA
mgnify:CR=1 FL=1